jgi:hypothetical protein
LPEHLRLELLVVRLLKSLGVSELPLQGGLLLSHLPLLELEGEQLVVLAHLEVFKLCSNTDGGAAGVTG